MLENSIQNNHKNQGFKLYLDPKFGNIMESKSKTNSSNKKLAHLLKQKNGTF